MTRFLEYQKEHTAIWFFGALKQVGHGWHRVVNGIIDPDRRWTGPLPEAEPLWMPPEDPDQKTGEARLTYGPDQIFMGWWDRTVDRRRGSHSALVFRREDFYSAAALLSEAKRILGDRAPTKTSQVRELKDVVRDVQPRVKRL